MRCHEPTEEVTGPSCADVPLAVKLTPLGAFSLTSRAAAGVSVVARTAQLVSPTCGSVVEVLVDELEETAVSNGVARELWKSSHNIRRLTP